MKLGILGAGQLGRMLAQAAAPLGVECRFLAPAGETCVQGLGELLQGDMSDDLLLTRFAKGLDAVTYEWENVPAAAVERLARLVPVRPGARSLRCAQDRVHEKQFFRGCGLTVQAFAPVDAPRDFVPALAGVPLPAMLKTRRMGYDGKGQARIDAPDDLPAAFERLGSVPCILEAFVPFESEMSLLGVRSVNADGREEIRLWSPCRNEHRDGILDRTVAPAANLPEAWLARARAGMAATLSGLDHEGVLCIEFFVSRDGLVANEMAPRVHNSGHWTIEGAQTSQFENHVRAALRMPLGPTESGAVSVLRNLVGDVPVPGAKMPASVHLHLYGKSPRTGRKLGHLTAVAQRESDAMSAADAAFAALNGQPASARG
ncbi:MAG: 5-(carboxyamino)imidazole ribonucleotide synthase [Phycisphaerales bacterium]